MKRSFTCLSLLLLLVLGSSLQAQVSFSCTYREYCDWDETNETFINCEGYAENSLFEMNEQETMFTHTTNNLKSTYFVKSKEYDEENEVFFYDVVSDVGNPYLYIFDLENKQIRVLIYNGAESELIRFSVKAIF